MLAVFADDVHRHAAGRACHNVDATRRSMTGDRRSTRARTLSASRVRALRISPRKSSASVAKALSSAYLPIAGVMIPEEMYQALITESKKIGTFGHGFTYSGHPVAAAVALKTLDIYARERIAEQAARKAPQFLARLARLGEHPLVGEARGLGLVAALELVADKRTKRSFEP